MIKELKEFGIKIYGYDPLLTKEEIEEFSAKALDELNEKVDCVVVTAAHDEFKKMTLKDVFFDRYGVLAMVNGKTGMRRERLIWSMPYVAQWLEMHPRHEEREAPLWVKMSNSQEAFYGVS
jgi:hypothetical protein